MTETLFFFSYKKWPLLRQQLQQRTQWNISKNVRDTVYQSFWSSSHADPSNINEDMAENMDFGQKTHLMFKLLKSKQLENSVRSTIVPKMNILPQMFLSYHLWQH